MDMIDRTVRNRWLLGIVISLLPFVASFATDPEEDTYPTVGRLFHIARSVNKNLVCYDVNLRDGRLDTHDPLRVYWINREKHPGETNGLSYIQRKMAYGYKLISASDDTCVCSLVAYPSRRLTIARRGSRYVCYMTIDGQQALLRSLYVKASPKNPLQVEYVELRGISVATDQPITERVRK